MKNIDFTNRKIFWTPTRLGIAAGLIILAVALFTALYPRSKTPGSKTPAGSTGSAAVIRELSGELREADLNLISGAAKTVGDYEGKVLVLDLWATWCGPCRQEIPHLVAMANDYRDRGVEVLGLTTEDPQADLYLVRNFAQRFSINYEIGFANDEVASEIMRGRNGIPQTLIIDRQGRVRKHFVGFHPRLSLPQMKSALEEVLAAD
ncbi:MAG: TlpA family protein disulfide reductase [Acidobacteria bacterium]|nr:TlpA family protein disulfide reductase [Acidobacteriota bacterium]